MRNEAQWTLNSKIGPLYLVASENGLRGVFWKKQKAPLLKSLKGESPVEKWLSCAAIQLEEYLNGDRKKFDLSLDLSGTDFQMKVWKALIQIPFGTTVSYQKIAEKIKNPNAVRAVGTANGKNPLCLIIPCHRVIASDGSLGGYSGGLKIKKILLELEQSSNR